MSLYIYIQHIKWCLILSPANPCANLCSNCEVITATITITLLLSVTFWINSFFCARAPGADLNSYNHSLYESIIVFLVLPNGSLSFCCLSVWEILAPLTRSPFSRPPPNFIVCSDSHSYSKQQPLYSWVLSLSSFSVLLVE